MTTKEGPVDNYLSAEEKAYFESGGKSENEFKYSDEGVSETISDSEELSNNDTGTTDDSRNVAPNSEVDAESSHETTEPETDDDGENAPENTRDYEKAFKAERYKRRELKEALETQAKKAAEMEETLAQLKQSMLTPKTESSNVLPEIIPDPDEDPLGYQQYELDKIKEAVIKQNEYLNQQHESAIRQAQRQAFLNSYQKSAQEFAKTNADFYEAYKYIVGEKTKEYLALGYNQQEADSLLIEDEFAMAAKAYQDKANPAERIYKLATARGYTPTPTSKAPPKDLANVKKGLDNSKSLKSGGGELGEKDQGLGDIDNMNFQEFDAYWEKIKAKSKGR